MENTDYSHDHSDRNLESRRDAILNDLIKDFSSVFLITINDDGEITLRPMQIIDVTEPGVIWFVASRESDKVRQAIGAKVVYITGQAGSTFIAAKGEPEIFVDALTRRKLWTAQLRAWFPKGVDDPDLCFMRVKISEGEYWTTTGVQRISFVLKELRAVMSGTKVEIEEPYQHGKVHHLSKQ